MEGRKWGGRHKEKYEEMNGEGKQKKKKTVMKERKKGGTRR